MNSVDPIPSRTHVIGRSLAAWLITISMAIAAIPAWAAEALKPRIIVLTDISPANVEPDDQESLIRLLSYADQFEIEGLVATTGWSSGGNHPEWVQLIDKTIDAYEKDLPNLKKRSGQEGFEQDNTRQHLGYWPSAAYLRSVTVVGSQKRGMSAIGRENTSKGSDLIIKAVDAEDDRPVWVLAWGGGNTLAQAIWQVKSERSPDQLRAFLKKIRFYAITDQDRSCQEGTPFEISSHQWLRREFENDLFFLWDESAWRYQNGTGRSRWDEYAEQIQGKANLGAMYPKYRYGVEGDTPSFLYVMPNGLNAPEHPGWGGWGGYFEWGTGPDKATKAYVNQSGTPASAIAGKYEARFYSAIFNDFVARMNWAENGAGNRNPVVVVNGQAGLEPFEIHPGPGQAVSLDASSTTDPDANNLRFSWWILSEAGSYKGEVRLMDDGSEKATVLVPADADGKTIHVVCEVTDDGSPSLTGYRRIILAPGNTTVAH